MFWRMALNFLVMCVCVCVWGVGGGGGGYNVQCASNLAGRRVSRPHQVLCDRDCRLEQWPQRAPVSTKCRANKCWEDQASLCFAEKQSLSRLLVRDEFMDHEQNKHVNHAMILGPIDCLHDAQPRRCCRLLESYARFESLECLRRKVPHAKCRRQCDGVWGQRVIAVHRKRLESESGAHLAQHSRGVV